MLKDGCERCENYGDNHNRNCLVRTFIFDHDKAKISSSSVSALEAAILAVDNFKGRDKTFATMKCEIISLDSKKNERRGQSMGQLITKERDNQSNSDLNRVMEKVLLAGDLSKMEPRDRINYYLKTCESLGMNPMSKPFDLITLNGKMVLYPNRSGTDQLRKIGNVDVKVTDKGFDKDTGCYVVVAQATLPSGRSDEDMGIVYCLGLKGDNLANAQLKAMTKAKRRVTLSIMGLGWIDESEVSSVNNAKTHKMNLDTGDIIDDVKQEPAPKQQPEPMKSDNQTASNDDDICCGKKMMVSKFVDKVTGEYPLYCISCKSKRPNQKKSGRDELNEFQPETEIVCSDNFDNFQSTQMVEPQKQTEENLVELPWTKYMPKDPRMVK